MTEENVKKLLLYKKPWVSAHSHSSIGGEETKEIDFQAGVYLPCIPNLDHVVTLKPDSNQQELPQYLSHALIKCKAEIADEVLNCLAFASGKRSAILFDKSDGSLIRLKGCGNLD